MSVETKVTEIISKELKVLPDIRVIYHINEGVCCIDFGNNNIPDKVFLKKIRDCGIFTVTTSSAVMDIVLNDIYNSGLENDIVIYDDTKEKEFDFDLGWNVNPFCNILMY